MALTDLVLMPGTDYRAICDATRALTGGTAALKSGDIAGALGGVSGGGDHTVEDSIITRSVSGAYTNDRVTTLGANAMAGCTALTSVDFPLVTGIPSSAFAGCSKLISANLPLAASCGVNAFSGCKLTAIDLPSLTSINALAFNACAELAVLILRNASGVCTLANANAFNGTAIKAGTGHIYVPAALADSYKTATNWAAYAEQIRAIEDYPGVAGS